jgi:hypothetical protein
MAIPHKKDRDLIISMLMNFSIVLVILLVASCDHLALAVLPQTLLTFIFGYLVVVLPLWFLRRWKYIRLTAISMLFIFFGGSAIFGVIEGIYWVTLIGGTSCVWMTYELIKEISKQKTLGKSQLSNDSAE